MNAVQTWYYTTFTLPYYHILNCPTPYGLKFDQSEAYKAKNTLFEHNLDRSGAYVAKHHFHQSMLPSWKQSSRVAKKLQYVHKIHHLQKFLAFKYSSKGRNAKLNYSVKCAVFFVYNLRLWNAAWLGNSDSSLARSAFSRLSFLFALQCGHCKYRRLFP